MRPTLAALCLLALTACAGYNPPNASPTEVQRRAVAGDDTSRIMLMTVMSTRADTGAHTALLIEGNTRVIWNPAGTFIHPDAPEVNDLHHGITENMEKVFIDYHVRPAYYMITQEMPVDRATADRLIALAGSSGKASKSTCTYTTSGLLRDAGIDVKRTFLPKGLMTSFAEVPGVATVRIDETNVDTDHGVIFGEAGVAAPSPR